MLVCTHTHIHVRTTPLQWRACVALSGPRRRQYLQVRVRRTHTHTVFVPLRRRSCHVSLWQMTPVGKKSARRFCFRFIRAASLLLFTLLLLSNRVAFNRTAARSAACGISFIEIRGELMWLTKRRIRRKTRVRLIRKHIQSEVSVFCAKTKKSSKCAHKKQTWLFFQVEWTAPHFVMYFLLFQIKWNRKTLPVL